MNSVSLSRFRTVLQRLLDRCREHSVEWFPDEEEGTYVVEFDEGTTVSIFSRSIDEQHIVLGVILHLHFKVAATLSAEKGSQDWELLSALFDEAQSAVEGCEQEMDKIDGALNGNGKVGKHPPDEEEAVPFNPFHDERKLPREDLVDGDSGFDAEREGEPEPETLS
mgnify:CR=1 FL=1